MISSKDLVIGSEYMVVHSRKGTFWIRVKSVDGEWIRGEITKGIANAMLSYNVCRAGEEITIRDSMSQFYGCEDANADV